jgi:hypothetical protein
MNAARIKQDSSILLHIQDRDCVAMGVRYHKSCNRQYTRFLTKSAVTVTGTADKEVWVIQLHYQLYTHYKLQFIF